MKTTTYEYKCPKGGESAYISHNVFSDGDEEFLSHIPDKRVNRHSSFDKAESRIQMHGYKGHEGPINECTEVPKSYKYIIESFDLLITEAVTMKQQWKNKVKEIHGNDVVFSDEKVTDRYSIPRTVAHNTNGDMVAYIEKKSGRSSILPKS